MEFDEFRLAASTADLSEEPAAREHADCVEFRMDLADAPLDALAAYDGSLPLLVTNRPRWEGGETRPDGRLDALAAAVDHKAVAAVDVELATLRGRPTGENDASVADLVGRAREAGVTVVASVHDFAATPDPRTLDALSAAAARAGDVGKLAVTASDRDDALALLSATHRATRRGERVATMAMGEAGRHTRAVAPVYGSRIGYAPVRPEAATAPGQYDLATLRELVESLA
ncbi:type I 3-dehydroquinate dehydratase [Candidatus Halobonum tyrrellensis]|uniref:type I 3-dehydroquinate dehydratase n=1 Tax=Candidatus Halobonum tyrrellensis TaxID=1431545 RepID=UPI0006780B61|nr:type I 3-dehydroquinate dehydratase [Candidatus Halobonum tyrrellensis]